MPEINLQILPPPWSEAAPSMTGNDRRGETMRKNPILTQGQKRALQTIAASEDGRLPGVHWITPRALRHLGLCVLGPGRTAQLTAAGRSAVLLRRVVLPSTAELNRASQVKRERKGKPQ